MSKEITLSLVKPDAFNRSDIGGIISMIEESGLKILGLKTTVMSKQEAERFYQEHEGKGFFDLMTNIMSAGPCVVMLIEGKDSIQRLRALMGHTDPTKADAGTIRAKFGTSLDDNAIHGSDSPASAKREIAFFFSEIERVALKAL